MKIGMVGLGKMGGDMTRRLLKDKHQVTVFDLNKETVKAMEAEGAMPASSLGELCQSLPTPRVVWIMVPAGSATDTVIKDLSGFLGADDIIVDGGNSNYRDSKWRASQLKEKKIRFLDAGTSGGIWGLAEGYCLMVGGELSAAEHMTPIFQSLAPAPDRGWAYVGPSGAGHFVKMAHNGIEYGLMQAYAEGFELLKAKSDFNLDLAQIAELWRHGSVVRSWLLDLTAEAYRENPGLEGIEAWVSDSGEGRWTVQEAVDLGVPLPVISQALFSRFGSRRKDSFAAKTLAAMRNKFGGHFIKKKK